MLSTKIKDRMRDSFILWRDSLNHIYLNRFISYFPSHHIRLFLLRKAGAQIEKGVAIHSGCQFWNPKGLKICSGTSIGFNCILDARKGLIIGNNVCIASEVMIWTLQHDYNSINFSTDGGPVIIENYTWLCSRCIILPNIMIREGTIVASAAVVTKSTSPYFVYGGIPAKQISNREKKDYCYSPSNYKLHIV